MLTEISVLKLKIRLKIKDARKSKPADPNDQSATLTFSSLSNRILYIKLCARNDAIKAHGKCYKPRLVYLPL